MRLAKQMLEPLMQFREQCARPALPRAAKLLDAFQCFAKLDAGFGLRLKHLACKALADLQQDQRVPFVRDVVLCPLLDLFQIPPCLGFLVPLKLILTLFRLASVFPQRLAKL